MLNTLNLFCEFLRKLGVCHLFVFGVVIDLFVMVKIQK